MHVSIRPVHLCVRDGERVQRLHGVRVAARKWARSQSPFACPSIQLHILALVAGVQEMEKALEMLHIYMRGPFQTE